MVSARPLLESLGVTAEEVPRLPPDQGQAVLASLIAEACMPTTVWKIERGREAVKLLPRAWVLEHIELAAEAALFKDPHWEDWEYRRLLELYGPYGLADESLVRRLARRGLGSSNVDVNEAAQDFLEWKPEETAPAASDGIG